MGKTMGLSYIGCCSHFSSTKEGDSMRRKIFTFFALFMLLCAAFSCTKKQILHTESTYSPEMFGSYTLFLYGARFSNDIETIAILDREGDRFTFEIFKPEFDFKVITGVPAAKAFDEGNKFIRFHRSFYSSQMVSILGSSGEIIGYEIRPLYLPTEFGYSDVMDVSYTLIEDTVKVKIQLKPHVRYMLYDEGGKRPFMYSPR